MFTHTPRSYIHPSTRMHTHTQTHTHTHRLSTNVQLREPAMTGATLQPQLPRSKDLGMPVLRASGTSRLEAGWAWAAQFASRDPAHTQAFLPQEELPRGENTGRNTCTFQRETKFQCPDCLVLRSGRRVWIRKKAEQLRRAVARRITLGVYFYTEY